MKNRLDSIECGVLSQTALEGARLVLETVN